MDTRQLARIDLNLLVALQILIEECNVSKAADRLYITQSAMSKTLGRLRELFDDPLFTRSSYGMTPTPRALEIQKKLNFLLQEVHGLVAPQTFEPWSYHGEFKIAIPEYIGMVILPTLMDELQQEAPNVRIVSISRVDQQLEKLASGELDIAMQVKHANYSNDFSVSPISRLPPVCLVRQSHPLRTLHEQPELDEIFSYPMVVLYVPDLQELEMVQRGRDLRSQNTAVNIVFETSHMFTAIEVVKRTNCVLIGPPFITRHPQLGVGVASIPLPVKEDGYINYVMTMHRRTDSSAIHQWMREKIHRILKRFEKKEDSGDPYRDYKVGQHSPFFGPLLDGES
jgi:DNA-binding transcriptional LysR family regulator